MINKIEEETIETEGIRAFNVIEILAHLTVALTIVITIAA